MLLEGRYKHDSSCDPDSDPLHRTLDKAVDKAFGLTGGVDNERRLKALFVSYEKFVTADQLEIPKGRARKK